MYESPTILSERASAETSGPLDRIQAARISNLRIAKNNRPIGFKPSFQPKHSKSCAVAKALDGAKTSTRAYYRSSYNQNPPGSILPEQPTISDVVPHDGSATAA